MEREAPSEGSDSLPVSEVATVKEVWLPRATKMLKRAIKTWWTEMKPYYTQAYQEMWVGVGIMGYLYYRLSYGGKKAVKDKPTAHGHH
ncbi:ATP synthase subunit ATP5MPL, mitochondrial isoform X1 [Rhinatrema bivittatum]|uniref:ATP synthase subunit ATP5MPL, mitochondrial isoform X1 n=2 Tax=Rhinatrema bivittatum TaxID=194408 RepID=UPI00112E7023|nr:ATP synthase subunit ATP5MPL, mitochondrial isoform X1 [Rhinatrema bivittatum]